jgi:hypothetical protein
MAQAGFTPISIYYSTTAAAVPTAPNLVSGELAINIVDEKLYFKNSAGTVKLLASSAAGTPVTTFSGGTTGFTPSTATSGAVTLAGILAIANGGTGTATPSLVAGSNVTITGTWPNQTVAASSSGSVSSVGQTFTGGLISVAGSPITSSGTLALTVAGTSGGLVYFNSASTWASSSVLTQYGVIYGGGAGATPVSTAAGTTGQVLTATTSGAPTWQSAAGGVSAGKSIAFAMIFGY